MMEDPNFERKNLELFANTTPILIVRIGWWRIQISDAKSTTFYKYDPNTVLDIYFTQKSQEMHLTFELADWKTK